MADKRIGTFLFRGLSNVFDLAAGSFGALNVLVLDEPTVG